MGPSVRGPEQGLNILLIADSLACCWLGQHGPSSFTNCIQLGLVLVRSARTPPLRGHDVVIVISWSAREKWNWSDRSYIGQQLIQAGIFAASMGFWEPVEACI